jgi:hypothetical protein
MLGVVGGGLDRRKKSRPFTEPTRGYNVLGESMFPFPWIRNEKLP